MKVKRARKLLARQLQFQADGVLPVTELEAIYELSFFNIFVAFENELVELMKTNLIMAHDSKGRIRSIFAPQNRALAERLLLGNNRYFQLLPVEQMEKIAKVYLKNGWPFVSLTEVQKASIRQAYAVRNHIAHRSSESKASFKKKVLNFANLPRSSTSPGYYLRNKMTISVTYFDHQVAQIGSCLKQIADAS
ncbi:hypothetical protein [Rhizobium cremeum]|uniref:hypothetical protein n=1 Tax=Rhizobium cremeum TaxID=2813827 RepID=UPI0039DF2B8A